MKQYEGVYCESLKQLLQHRKNLSAYSLIDLRFYSDFCFGEMSPNQFRKNLIRKEINGFDLPRHVWVIYFCYSVSIYLIFNGLFFLLPNRKPKVSLKLNCHSIGVSTEREVSTLRHNNNNNLNNSQRFSFHDRNPAYLCFTGNNKESIFEIANVCFAPSRTCVCVLCVSAVG